MEESAAIAVLVAAGFRYIYIHCKPPEYKIDFIKYHIYRFRLCPLKMYKTLKKLKNPTDFT